MSNKEAPSTLDALVQGIEREKMPDKELWNGIEYAMAHDSSEALNKHNRRNILYGLAASVAIVALVGVFSFQSGQTSLSEQLVQQMSEQHLAQKEALLVALDGQATVTQNWQQQLAELDKAADAIKKALQNEPNNAALLKMLKQVHQQQIALIERVHAPAWQQI